MITADDQRWFIRGKITLEWFMFHIFLTYNLNVNSNQKPKEVTLHLHAETKCQTPLKIDGKWQHYWIHLFHLVRDVFWIKLSTWYRNKLWSWPFPRHISSIANFVGYEINIYNLNPLSMIVPLENIIRFPLEVLLLLVHISVTVFILVKVVRKSVSYESPFFKLFLAQSLSNYLSYTTVSIYFYRLNNFLD
jgi:hypothetical protein